MTQRLSSNDTARRIGGTGLKQSGFYTFSLFSPTKIIFSLNSHQTRFQKTTHVKTGARGQMTTTTEAIKKDDDLWDEKKKRTVNPRT